MDNNNEVIEVSDEEIRAYIRERGPNTQWKGWGPRPRLSWEDARRDLIALKKSVKREKG